MKPSEKAIQAAQVAAKHALDEAYCTSDFYMDYALCAAYAIDVDPLLEQKDREIERLNKQLEELNGKAER